MADNKVTLGIYDDEMAIYEHSRVEEFEEISDIMFNLKVLIYKILLNCFFNEEIKNFKTIYSLAPAMGVSNAYVYKLLYIRTNYTTETILKIFNSLKYDINFIIMHKKVRYISENFENINHIFRDIALKENKNITAISKASGKSQESISEFLKLKSYHDEIFSLNPGANNLEKLAKILNYTPSLEVIQKSDEKAITVKFTTENCNPNHKIDNLIKLADILNCTCSFEAVRRADKSVIKVKKNDVFLYYEFIQRTRNFQDLSKGRKPSIYKKITFNHCDKERFEESL